ncbi:hypothetical protein [Paenibacillus hunanensis]|uniref:Uncharacterized protein n=1 Tax=Paenibacillus hunanensis TaxID=539262 RepID=A0ABU1J4P7_9BACL|nr:hypothetical protein [Paenibacillus hunanensis]MCL9663517.1 hypothetical protein [Paenibacillus hunanensis]MDR6246426.1 hypothetical protein [Paenibacillus hunanensis]GGJ31490.1 hypothetical protein GCM10008022_45240 [Paenibacillus hunanensis]
MGVKHGRDYEGILNDLTKALDMIPDGYLFFQMSAEEWEGLNPEERREVQEALAEDLFYALGSEPTIQVGSGVVIYAADTHRIDILIGETEMTFVSLI